jgi:hypothetical protein
VIRSRRLALLFLLAMLSLPLVGAAAQTAAAGQTAELRPGDLDMVLLVDKSLSMAPYFGEVKRYIETKVIGPILVPGDRLVVEAVYGKTDRLLSMQLGSEADKAKAARAINGLRADGHFTDLGAALDAAKRDLDELGQAQRPKYVLLITDERQEAPKGSRYAAPDYRLKHPSLEYVKRVDMGKFRVITVGLLVGEKVEANAPKVMELLKEAPLRGGGATGIGAQAGAGAAGAPAPATGNETQAAGGAAAGAATATGQGASAAGGGAASGGSVVGGGATPAERALPAWLLYTAAGLLALALAGLALLLVVSKKKKSEKEKATT